MSDTSQRPSTFKLAIVVAALGYFVDIYDLLLFGVIRVPSLKALGLSGDALTSAGVLLLNTQMIGMLIGGVLWGVLGDRRGRVSVLFGSILLYSLANIGNGFVQTIAQYAVLRFLAGVGLAGELGAGITLVSESMSAERRGLGTTIVAAVGICGGIAAGLVGDLFGWRTSYFIGGGLGLSLLLMRASAYESGMFEKTRKSASFRGNFLKLLTDGSRLRRYIAVILVAVPIWYVVGILVTLAPEMGRAMGMDPVPNPARAIMFCYTGIAVGDVVSGLLSQYLRSRKRALRVFLMFLVLTTVAYFLWARTSLTAFYVTVTALGLAAGYWAVFVTSAAEQFGTNLRATATTTAPNFVRGSLVPVSLLYGALKDKVGATESAIATGIVVLVLAFISLSMLEETYGRELDFTEE